MRKKIFITCSSIFFIVYILPYQAILRKINHYQNDIAFSSDCARYENMNPMNIVEKFKNKDLYTKIQARDFFQKCKTLNSTIFVYQLLKEPSLTKNYNYLDYFKLKPEILIFGETVESLSKILNLKINLSKFGDLNSMEKKILVEQEIPKLIEKKLHIKVDKIQINKKEYFSPNET